MNEELPLSQCHGNNKNFQPESSPLNSQDSLPDSNGKPIIAANFIVKL